MRREPKENEGEGRDHKRTERDREALDNVSHRDRENAGRRDCGRGRSGHGKMCWRRASNQVAARGYGFRVVRLPG